MKTPSRLILFALLFSLAFGCNKDTLLFQNKGTASFLPSGKGSALGAEKSLFSADSNYVALFEEYKGAFIDFRDSMIQNHGLSALQISLTTFNDCIAQDSTDLNCFSFISNLTDSSAVLAYYSAVATYSSALRGDYNTLTDAEFEETLKLTIEASVRTHYTENPLTAILNIELGEINPPAQYPPCYEEWQDNIMLADAAALGGSVACGILAGPAFLPCVVGVAVLYSAAQATAGVIYCDCMNDNYGYNC